MKISHHLLQEEKDNLPKRTRVFCDLLSLLSKYFCDKKNRTTAKRESDLLITSLITDRIGRHESPVTN